MFSRNVTFSVSKLNQYIKNLLSGDSLLSSVWVYGEISNFKLHISGHMYFTLKDKDSIIKCVMFKGNSKKLKFSPEHGMQVLALGYVSLYEQTGQYQLYVEDLIIHGAGELNLKYEQLKNKLTKEGLFDIEQKRDLPRMPKKVGVVTSLTGAVIKDIISIIHRRSPMTEILIAPAMVQGVEAPTSIITALDNLYDKDVDVIIVGRGGGSLEELWCFNNEQVVRKVSESPVPIISAVGHETDFSLTDFAADLRAATPSMAAELVVPTVKELKDKVDFYHTRLNQVLFENLEYKKQELSGITNELQLLNPLNKILVAKEKIDNMHLRINTIMENKYKSQKQILDLLIEKLDSLSPLKTLARGYCICLDDKANVVKSIHKVNLKKQVKLLLNDGQLICNVVEKKDDIYDS
ncbi:Exodeoxyribonuclease VII large subunit [Desulfonispora thiosulfatigenes DSM 11270]|uniref:Exodeoxyribonuclease 7 large subunit n=1 Tax=Desulfonispora thiosulfatigenes DSM 11270 TaxID=656914 RepID=A0A1W1VNI3_DESTI|nr:exodeoxyribonuclease VII large subunit [Desulfonispora thiosulfatigenes]SMB94888.1 Exodeoxyribonuclease VII large subunit [Desulfonispora thiosulfatigenes DSM 11270]